jgi:hypothetical protein
MVQSRWFFAPLMVQSHRDSLRRWLIESRWISLCGVPVR